MTDTSSDIQQKQREILLQKSPKERFLIGAELIDFGRVVLETNIRNMNPEWNDIEIKIEMFSRCYANCFTREELQRIIHSMKSHFDFDAQL
jgi:hypothetical protein